MNDNNNSLNPIQRNITSREGIRVPSREKPSGTPEIRKKNIVFGNLSTSQQNFYNQQQKENTNEYGSSTDDYMLATVNIGIDETGFVATTKADILQLQDDINKLDLDGRIRSMTPSELQKKNHIYSMMKFLSRFSNANVKKQIEQKLAFSSSFSTENLIKFMGVKNEEDGLRKLFKILNMLDLMILKMTELNIVSFLKYDQIYENLRKQYGANLSNKLSGMDGGITLSRFQSILANLEREMELFGFLGKSGQRKSEEEPSSGTQGISSVGSVEELYERFKSGENFGFQGEVLLSLIEMIESNIVSKKREADLLKKIQRLEAANLEKNSTLQKLEKGLGDKESSYKEEEAKLFQKMQQLESDFAEKAKKLEEEYLQKSKVNSAFKTSVDTKELEFSSQIKKLESTIRELREDNANLKSNEAKLQDEIKKLKENNSSGSKTQTTNLQNAGLEYQLSMLQQLETNYGEKVKKLEDLNAKTAKENLDLRVKIEGLEADREEIQRRLKEYQKQEEIESKRLREDSYEAALREQFNSMKIAFEEKIKSLNDSIQQIKKEKGREIIDIKNELTRERDGRELLLRKLQLYTKS